MYLLAGHGGESDGRQCIIINEYDEKTGFYKLCRIENFIRSAAKFYPRSYHVVFYACCREIFTKTKHTGGFKGPHAEAQLAYDNLKKDQAAAATKTEQFEDLSKKLEESENRVAMLLAKYVHDDADDQEELKEPSKNEAEDDGTRGNTDKVVVIKVENWVFCFGAPPGWGVGADTSMI